MDEKVLIKGELKKVIKKKLIVVICILFILSAIGFLSLGAGWRDFTGYSYRPLSDGSSYRYSYTYTLSGYDLAFNGWEIPLITFILSCALAAAGIVLIFIFIAHRKCELTITEKNVRGKSLWGKEVVLPLYMVSAYSTRKFLSTITIATSSGTTKFSMMENYTDIGKILSDKINERQDKTTTSAPATSEGNSMDDLVKLKDLLDQGIITQEEFATKKKQMLGL